MLKQIPNFLTLIRFLLIVPFMLCLLDEQYIGAFYIYIIAGFTDGLDGMLARRFAWQTETGALMDPLADKLLIVSSFMGLAWLNLLSWWVVALVLFRDLIIVLGATFWYLFMQKLPNMKPTFVSKMNTTLQLSCVLICLYEKAFPVTMPAILIPVNMGLMVLTTSISLADYVWTWGKKAWLHL